MHLFKLLILLFIPSLCIGQDIPKLSLTREGVGPIVVEIAGKSAPDLYSSSLEWVQKNYKNPDKVLKSKIDNKSIRIEAFQADGFVVKALGKAYMDYYYTLEIDFKAGKYRLTYSIGDIYNQGRKALYKYPTMFKKDGTLKGQYAGSLEQSSGKMNGLGLATKKWTNSQAHFE